MGQSWLLKQARTKTVNIMRQYSHPVHSAYNPGKTRFHRHPGETRLSFPLSKKNLTPVKEKSEESILYTSLTGRECPINPERDSRVNIYAHKSD